MNVNDYLNLIPSENRNKPRFRAWLSLCVGIISDIANCANSVAKAFSVDYAVGKQLDIIGLYVGASRKLSFQPTEGSRILTDIDFRKLIRATIAKNAWDGTNESLPYLLNTSFPELGVIITDNQDMTMNAIVRGTFNTLQLEMLNADLLLPRPAGVSMVYEVPTQIPATNVYIQSGTMVTSIQQIEEE